LRLFTPRLAESVPVETPWKVEHQDREVLLAIVRQKALSAHRLLDPVQTLAIERAAPMVSVEPPTSS